MAVWVVPTPDQMEQLRRVQRRLRRERHAALSAYVASVAAAARAFRGDVDPTGETAPAAAAENGPGGAGTADAGPAAGSRVETHESNLPATTQPRTEGGGDRGTRSAPSSPNPSSTEGRAGSSRPGRRRPGVAGNSPSVHQRGRPRTAGGPPESSDRPQTHPNDAGGGAVSPVSSPGSPPTQQHQQQKVGPIQSQRPWFQRRRKRTLSQTKLPFAVGTVTKKRRQDDR